MKPFARRFERQLHHNLQQHVFANELRTKAQRLKACFSGNSLPLPTAEVIAAWNDLPNKTVDVLPMSMKTGLVFPRAPPPTPTGLTLDADEAVWHDPFLDDGSNDSWLFVGDTDFPTPDVVAFRVPEPSVANTGDSTSRYSYPDQLLGGQPSEGDSIQPAHSNSPSTDHESLSSSSSRASPTPVGFHNMVNQWLLDYRTRGLEPFIESLIAFGVMSLGTASLASRVARAVSRTVAKTSSYTEGKNLENSIRLTALAAFEKYWGSKGTWMEVSSTRANALSPTQYGINIASFMGGLFDAGIYSAKDIHLCLSLLSEVEKCPERLCAMHALLVKSNDKLCKSRNLPALMQFKHEITSRDGETGEYLWGTTPHSKTIVADILTTIERWHVLQARKRDQFRLSPSFRTIRQRAVGPRLRDGRPVESFIACI